MNGLIVALLSIPALAGTHSTAQRGSDGPEHPWTDTRMGRPPGADRLATGFVRRHFEPSLESKEGVDFLFAPVFLVQEAMSAETMPGALGKETVEGRLQFDAIVALEHTGLRPPVELYVRYWVSLDDYQAAIVWVEPHGRDLRLPMYPPTLRIASGAAEFSIISDVHDSYNQTHHKPIFEEYALTGRFGNYPIGSSRFAEQEAVAIRIHADFLRALLSSDETVEGVEFGLPFESASPPLRPLSMKVSANRGRVDSIQLFGKEGLLKRITYDFEVEDGRRRLSRQHIDVPERMIMGSLPGDGIRVTVNDKPLHIKDVPLIFQKGGRRWTIEYDTFRLGAASSKLPVRVSVRSASDETALRSARLMGFKTGGMSFSESGRAALDFAGFKDQHREYRRLLTEYWKRAPEDVPEADLRVARELRHYFSDEAVKNGGSLGQQLRRLNILMELSRLSGDQAELEIHYKRYLTTLGSNQRFDMMLAGGYGAIDTLMLWGRFVEADALLGIWLNEIDEVIDIETVRRYARRELARGNLWTTIQLLKRFSTQPELDGNVRFELNAMASVALDELTGQVLKRESSVTRAQANWVASSTPMDDLERLHTESLKETFRLLEGVQHPNEAQTALRRRVMSILPKVVTDR